MNDNKAGKPKLETRYKKILLNLDTNSEDILKDYCSKNNVYRAEAIREAIKLLK